MKNSKLLCGLVSAVLMLSACTAGHDAAPLGMKDGYRVGNARWYKTENLDPGSILDKSVAQDNASVFFIRDKDNGDARSSVNIAINGRFQTSLQPSHYSQVYTCAGINQISGEITGAHNNDLLRKAQRYNLEGGKSYYFRVLVDASGQAQIIPIQHQDEIEKTHQKQNHQISRVVTNCQSSAASGSIELSVYFDSGRSAVKPRYYAEIEKVAAYLNANPESRVVIEGHTDNQGGEEYNQRLSQSRVDAVKAVLVNRYNIDASRIEAVGYGESRPAFDNSTASGRAQNRRVIAVFYTK